VRRYRGSVGISVRVSWPLSASHPHDYGNNANHHGSAIFLQALIFSGSTSQPGFAHGDAITTAQNGLKLSSASGASSGDDHGLEKREPNGRELQALSEIALKN
jgi:hypothetical protein